MLKPNPIFSTEFARSSDDDILRPIPANDNCIVVSPGDSSVPMATRRDSNILVPHFNKGRPDVYTKRGVLLPYIEGEDIFEGHEKAKQFIGMFAINGNIAPGMAYANIAAQQLRGRVYENLGWIEPDKVGFDGRESDEYDARSVQIGVVQNSEYGPLLHGGVRLILSQPNEPLPVEEKYGFTANEGATELSRLIFQHPDKTIRAAGQVACFRAMIRVGLELDYKVAYGMVEPYLPNLLAKRKLAHKMLSDFEPTPEYGNSNNALLFVDPHELLDRTKPWKGGSLATYLFFRIAPNSSLGYYRDNLCLFREGSQKGTDDLIERHRRNNHPDPDPKQYPVPSAA